MSSFRRKVLTITAAIFSLTCVFVLLSNAGGKDVDEMLLKDEKQEARQEINDIVDRISQLESKLTQVEEELKSNVDNVKTISKSLRSPAGKPTDAEAIARFRQYGNRSYEELYKVQLHFCGELCDMSTFQWRDVELQYAASQLQEFFVKKNVDCDRLFLKEVAEFLEPVPFQWPPPRQLPLADAYTFNGKIPVKEWFFAERYSGGTALQPRWTQEAVNDLLAQLKQRTMHGTYGPGPTNFFADVLKEVNLKGKHVMVIGSEKPWVEVAALAAGAKRVTTLEYGRIISEVPEIDTMTPSEMNERYRNGTMPQIDVAISFSSLEHSGLGRYGDGINPWGDLLTVAKVSCVVKQKTGHIVFGIPSGAKDFLYYNAHRVYGPNRWPLFLTNWWPEKMWKEKTGQFENGIVYARNERI